MFSSRHLNIENEQIKMIMNKSWFKILTPWALGLAGSVLLMAVTSSAWDWPVATKVAAKGAIPIVVNDAPLERDTKFTVSFASVVKKIAPCVVNISSTKTIRQQPMPEFFLDPFRQFFGGDLNGRSRRPRTFNQTSLGSGVIVTKDGYLLTNNHVVDGADVIKVSMTKSKTEYDAKVVGRDPKTDVAVLKIEANNLPFATLADSSKIEVGDVVLAIGSPFGLSQTVTMGIISAVGRHNMGIEDYEDFIQTDAAINQGNSGGALVDAEGRLIGINTAILSPTGGSIGVGFAVPINLARSIMDRLLKDGKVDRGFLGVGIQDVTAELADQFKVPEGQGALVGEVVENSAAAAAGLKFGDVIIELDGKKVKDGRQLTMLVAEYSPGTKVKVKVLRDGRERSFDVTLKSSSNQSVAAGGKGGTDNADDALNGVSVSDLNNALRNQLEIPPGIRGAVVVEIDEESPAYRDGLRQGDVVLEINRQPVRNAEEAVEASKNLKNTRILLRVFSHGRSRYLVVDETKKK